MAPIAGRWKRPALHGVDVEPAVAVEVQECHAAAHGLGEMAVLALTVVEREHKAPRLGLVAELRDISQAGNRGFHRAPRIDRLQQVGKCAAAGRGGWNPRLPDERIPPRPRPTDSAWRQATTKSWHRTADRSRGRHGRARPRARADPGR